MIYITDDLIDKFIKEDVPYLDLTTWILEIGNQKGKIEFFCREEAVLCGTEEVLRIFKKLNITPLEYLPSGSILKPNEVFLAAEGTAAELHRAWKISQNILEHCSGIATKTRVMLNKAKKINPNISIVTTRKGFPGTKELATKAVLVGGAFPHRLGLSETVLVFKQHLNFIGGMDCFIDSVEQIKSKACEKKVIVEAESIDEAIKLCKAGVDGIQFDKIPSNELTEAVKLIRQIRPSTALLAAGGINLDNIEEYANTGVDAIVTTNLYVGKPVDIGTKIIEV